MPQWGSGFNLYHMHANNIANLFLFNVYVKELIMLHIAFQCTSII